MSEPFGFKAFQAKVKKHQKPKQSQFIIFGSIALLFGMGFIAESGEHPPVLSQHNQETLQVGDRLITNPETVHNINFSDYYTWNSQRDFSLIVQAQVPMPATGFLQGANPSSSDANAGAISLFLRPPRLGEEASFPTTCKGENTHSYWVQFADFTTDEPITTAFVRAQEVLNLYLPVGNYKVRYAPGTPDLWLGETELFGQQDLYEMRKKDAPKEVEQIEILTTHKINIGFFCENGNLDRGKVSKDEVQLEP
ncbi:MAG: hypothetical protein AAFO95_02645 [Cyanobacteria bacterium J06600_6]